MVRKFKAFLISSLLLSVNPQNPLLAAGDPPLSCHAVIALHQHITENTFLGRAIKFRTAQLADISKISEPIRRVLSIDREDTGLKETADALIIDRQKKNRLIPLKIVGAELDEAREDILKVFKIIREAADGHREGFIPQEIAKDALNKVNFIDLTARLAALHTQEVSQLEVFTLISFIEQWRYVVEAYSEGRPLEASEFFGLYILRLLPGYSAHDPGSFGEIHLKTIEKAKKAIDNGYLILPIPKDVQIEGVDRNILQSLGILPYDMAHAMFTPRYDDTKNFFENFPLFQ